MSGSWERGKEVTDGMIVVVAHGGAFLDASEDQWFRSVEPLLEPASGGFFLEVLIGIAVEYVAVARLDQRALGVDFFSFPLGLGVLSLFMHGCIYPMEVCVSSFPVEVQLIPDILSNSCNPR